MKNIILYLLSFLTTFVSVILYTSLLLKILYFFNILKYDNIDIKALNTFIILSILYLLIAYSIIIYQLTRK